MTTIEKVISEIKNEASKKNLGIDRRIKAGTTIVVQKSPQHPVRTYSVISARYRQTSTEAAVTKYFEVAKGKTAVKNAEIIEKDTRSLIASLEEDVFYCKFENLRLDEQLYFLDIEMPVGSIIKYKDSVTKFRVANYDYANLQVTLYNNTLEKYKNMTFYRMSQDMSVKSIEVLQKAEVKEVVVNVKETEEIPTTVGGIVSKMAEDKLLNSSKNVTELPFNKEQFFIECYVLLLDTKRERDIFLELAKVNIKKAIELTSIPEGPIPNLISEKLQTLLK